MSKKAKLALTLGVVLTASMFLSGCGMFTKGKESIDPPGDLTYLKEGEELESAAEEEKEAAGSKENVETVMRDLYLIDKNGYVVAQTLPLPKTDSVAKQALEYLVTDGPISQIIPNGFRTVLPAGTSVDVDVHEGVATVDFSEEFENYEASDEKKILESVTWTLTQFDSIEQVEIRVNGYPLTEMPVGGTPIKKDGISRNDGINTVASATADITNTRPLTVYYLTQVDEEIYYVPVTKRVSNEEQDNVQAVINQLVEGPGLGKGLVSALHNDVKLMDTPSVEEDGSVVLNFNEFILGSSESKEIAEETLQSIVLSLTEQQDIDSVSIMVNGNADLVNEEGEALTAPVTRPEKVNKVGF